MECKGGIRGAQEDALGDKTMLRGCSRGTLGQNGATLGRTVATLEHKEVLCDKRGFFRTTVGVLWDILGHFWMHGTHLRTLGGAGDPRASSGREGAVLGAEPGRSLLPSGSHPAPSLLPPRSRPRSAPPARLHLVRGRRGAAPGAGSGRDWGDPGGSQGPAEGSGSGPPARDPPSYPPTPHGTPGSLGGPWERPLP